MCDEKADNCIESSFEGGNGDSVDESGVLVLVGCTNGPLGFV